MANNDYLFLDFIVIIIFDLNLFLTILSNDKNCWIVFKKVYDDRELRRESVVDISALWTSDMWIRFESFLCRTCKLPCLW